MESADYRGMTREFDQCPLYSVRFCMAVDLQRLASSLIAFTSHAEKAVMR
jgi:hypothetical protein